MTSGVEIFNKKGQRIFDGTCRLPKLIGMINAGIDSGSLTVKTSKESSGVWAYAFNSVDYVNSRSQAGIVSVSGKTIYWSNPFHYKVPMTIYYGEY